VRFSPISHSELPTLSCDVNLLLNFTPCEHPLDWIVGTHGLRVSFTYQGRRYGSTYLPHIASEQGWTKEETLISLMRKAGWPGRSSDWRNVGDLKCIRYEGKRADVDYHVWREWRTWVEREGKVI
jgi:AMME syndrome candidate gene 1 protein